MNSHIHTLHQRALFRWAKKQNIPYWISSSATVQEEETLLPFSPFHIFLFAEDDLCVIIYTAQFAILMGRVASNYNEDQAYSLQTLFRA